MTRIRILGCAWAMLAGSALAAPAAPTPSAPSIEAQERAWQQGYRQAMATHLQRLAASGDPRQLYAAALLVPVALQDADDERAAELDGWRQEWLDAALRRGADNPLLARAAVARCLSADPCDASEAVRTLQEAAQADLAAQLQLMVYGQRHMRTELADQAWQAAARATRYGDGFSEVLALLNAATADVELPPMTPELAVALKQGEDPATPQGVLQVHLFAIAAAHWNPGLKTALDACPDSRMDDDPVLARQCRAVFGLMAESGSLLGSRLGTNKMIGLAADEAGQARWLHRQRELQWLTQQTLAILQRQAVPPGYLQWVAEAGEVGAMRQLLAQHGIAPKPAADWSPPAG